MAGCSSRLSSLADGEIHVWTVRFADDDSLTTRRLALLDAGERARAARLVNRRHRMRFIQFHAFARGVLGGYLGVPADEVRLAMGPGGKPEIERRAADPALHFNISHSGDRCLLAARLGCPVGIDIEQERDMPDALAIAQRFFSRAEAELLARRDGAERRNAFFALWTHKEATVKALGASLAENMERVELTFDPAGHPQLAEHAATPPLPDGLWLRRLDAPAGYVAALASLGPCASIVSRPWNELAGAAAPAHKHALPGWTTHRSAPATSVRACQAFDHPRGA